MKRDQLDTAAKQEAVLRYLGQFAKQDSGMMTIFACFMVLIMIMVGGIGVDLMRNEMERTRLQAVADRAVLAAADLDQTQDPATVVQDYFDKSGLGEYVSSVTVEEGLNFRTVHVDASGHTDTQFMGALGQETLPLPAQAKAEEKVNKVEISLVLDISGSMDDNNKMENMQDAAGTFIDAVLKPENQDLISINLIPYSQHVNVGEPIFERMNVDVEHDYSHCIEFPNSDFGTTTLDTTRLNTQMQHFQWNYYSIQSGTQLNTRYDTVCPRYDYEAILPMSQDPNELKNQINQLKPRAGTQIFYGMKWAAGMLDPSFRSLNASLSGAGHVDGVFAVRPASYEDEETLKTIVLMTDGQNSSAVRIAEYYYRNESLRAHWRDWNFQYYLLNYVNSYYHNRFYYTKYSESQGDQLLYNMCDAAKAKHIVIWTIGFEVQDHGASVMEYCASSPSHFFRVEGVDISNAFEAIARQINQLRLTQ